MTEPRAIKPTDKEVKAYYATLKGYADQQVTHEGAVETAFQRLLSETGRPHGWMLVPKLSVRRGGRTIVPDGALRDEFNLHRGCWEAKDTDDDLNAEIRKKAAKGYLLVNTIFEDTRQAVLFQNGEERFRAELSDPRQLTDLLTAFYAYTEPDIEGFEQAIDEFKERVPELAKALAEKIRTAHDENAKFQAAFEQFFTLCQNSLNPNISVAAVDEMLVQHLLTERLIRKIFDNPEFTQRNAIAVEVKKVIAALVSKSFNRDTFLKSLDRFYRAIEGAARVLEDFSEKQHFLNTVYERFFQGYSVKVAATHGIVYTPQAIVDFMCASVAEVLESEFGKSLGDPEVQVLDPCTGTGNFVVNLLRRIPKKSLPRVYSRQLFANEVMLLPYYIAALNIEHAYYELTGQYEAFPGLCFVDTLDLAEKTQKTLAFMNEENTQRVVRQKNAPITLIIGNPPYNVGQLNENDNNKNRKYRVVDQRIKETYARESNATLKTQIYDPYVKFFRWATDRLNGRDGIVCFVSNNSFVDQIVFDGMRKCVLREFTKVYHVHLEGNVRQNPKLAGTTYNVFGIQVGVGITVAIRKGARAARHVLFRRVDKGLPRAKKLEWLSSCRTAGADWARLSPDSAQNWVKGKGASVFREFVPLGSKVAKRMGSREIGVVFQTFSPGVNSSRDAVVYGFQRKLLAARVSEACDSYNGEVDRYLRKGKVRSVDDFVNYGSVKWSQTLKRHLIAGHFAVYDPARIMQCLYRPFTKKLIYYDHVLVDRPGLFKQFFPMGVSYATKNHILCVPRRGNRQSFGCAVIDQIASMDFSFEKVQCFPFYVYSDDGAESRENISDWALAEFQERYRDSKITKWGVFHYVYGILHHSGFREQFAENLKRELPRLPFAPDFHAFRKAGQRLAELHVEYEKLKEYPLKWIETPKEPLSYRVQKMKLSKDKKSLAVNPSFTLDGIPPETFEYRLGNRSALEWVIDQYQVSTDKRSGIKSDPNRPDDPEYIVRLVGQVVQVSVETVRIVRELPKEFMTSPRKK